MYYQTGLLVLCTIALGVQADTSCPKAPNEGEGGDRRDDPTKFVIVTYNVNWLFPGWHDQSPWDGPDPARHHIAEVAAALDYINADAYVLQEVKDCDILEVMRMTMRNAHLYRSYLIEGTDVTTGQNVALLTKVDPKIDLHFSEFRSEYPVHGGACGNPHGSTGVAKHFVTRMEIFPGIDIGIIGVHLLAWPMSWDRCSKREGQADVIRNLLHDNLFRGTSGALVLGDFNDFSRQYIDAGGNIPLSNVIEIIKSSYVPGFSESAGMLPWHLRSTHREGGMQDHCLLSASLVPYLSSVHVLREVRASDHLPLVMTFDMNNGPNSSWWYRE
eukprot:TRINITY_DN4542_c0_g3_i1.p1 TRINITY_DN4542_c0_g3~~TRINITY_DN4542_c0_g3_i1.p1  ORF type:complete len:329 (+),score=16.92 TRINITY_DN4542_c0_g3_i1:48-1034(+)